MGTGGVCYIIPHCTLIHKLRKKSSLLAALFSWKQTPRTPKDRELISHQGSSMLLSIDNSNDFQVAQIFQVEFGPDRVSGSQFYLGFLLKRAFRPLFGLDSFRPGLLFQEGGTLRHRAREASDFLGSATRCVQPVLTSRDREIAEAS